MIKMINPLNLNIVNILILNILKLDKSAMKMFGNFLIFVKTYVFNVLGSKL